jgi:hypothetical protein
MGFTTLHHAAGLGGGGSLWFEEAGERSDVFSNSMVERRNGQEMQALVPTSNRGREGRKGMGGSMLVSSR